jgi:hypothetical protein
LLFRLGNLLLTAIHVTRCDVLSLILIHVTRCDVLSLIFSQTILCFHEQCVIQLRVLNIFSFPGIYIYKIEV